MQPTNPQRPVMDISTPRRPAPVPAKPPVQAAPAPDFSKAPSLPVHEAPQSDDTEESSPEHEQHPAPAANQDKQPPDPDASQTDDATNATPTPTGPPTPPREKTPLPVGAIVATLLVMIALSAAAILVYIKT